MTCWRCGRRAETFSTDGHPAWCSMPGGCGHCGWSPCRWWCAEGHVYAWTPSPNGYAVIIRSAA